MCSNIVHADARSMLKHGTIDPSDCTRSELMNTVTLPANRLWQDSPACRGKMSQDTQYTWCRMCVTA